MSVKAESLENAERDLDLVNRDGGKKGNEFATQLRALRQRIQAGLNSPPEDPRPDNAAACRACYQRGWQAALKSLLER